MNPQDTHEQLHGDLYNSNEWKVKQITKVIKPSNTLRDCPKDYSIYFLNKKKKLKVCGESFVVRGLIRIPKDNIEIESDRYKEGKVKVIKHIDKIRPFVFRTESFMAVEAKRYRKLVCNTCDLNGCSYKNRSK